MRSHKPAQHAATIALADRQLESQKTELDQVREHALKHQQTQLHQHYLVEAITDSAAEAKFQNLLESAPDAIVIVDAAGQIVIANHQAEQLFGYAGNELLGQPVDLLLPE